ncbi:hypothetical protein [Sphingomonas bacterium]|uniref:hypothetical protein n=1 Tax=Sphingomonas bacterium TaxID=1895847 RepID=UPI0020C665F0|nr:hypothetical protein [Sphingomonas bacterium]
MGVFCGAYFGGSPKYGNLPSGAFEIGTLAIVKSAGPGATGGVTGVGVEVAAAVAADALRVTASSAPDL